MKTTLLRITCIIAILSLCSLEDPNNGNGITPVFWGWSYGNESGTMSEGGTGNCYQEANAQHFIFWIGGSVQQRYRYVDCGTGSPLGDWTDSLMGLP